MKTCVSQTASDYERKIFKVMPWLFFLQFMQWFNENLFFISLPNITSFFGMTVAGSSWVISIAGIAFGVGCGVYAVLADITSMRKIFLFGVILFLTGSIIGFIFSDIFWMVIIARLIQTAGSGVVPACLFLFIIKYIPGKHKVRYFGYSAAVFQLSAALGNVAGGFVSQHLPWKYCFLFPLIIVICIPAFVKYLPTEEFESKKIDVLGALLLAMVIILIISAISTLNVYIFGITLLLIIVFIFNSRSQNKAGNEPFINMTHFKNYKFVLGLLIGIMIMAVQTGVFFVFPFLMIDIYNMSPVYIGIMYLPANCFAFFSGIFAGKIAEKIGKANCAIFGMIISGTGILIFSLCMGLSLKFMIWALIMFSSGYPFFFSGFMATFSQFLPAKHEGVCIGIYNILTNLQASIFPVVLGIVISANLFDVRILSIMDNISVINFSNIFLLFVVLFIISLILFKLLMKANKKDIENINLERC